MPFSLEQQMERVTRALTVADNLVWSDSIFPRSHRPDVDFLTANIKIAEQPSQYSFHPKMRPEVLRDLERKNKRFRIGKGSTFWYDGVTRELVVSRKSFDFPDQRFKRYVWNHAARDIAARTEVIEPVQYTDVLIESIDRLLGLAFEMKNRPSVDDTKVVKAGFRRTLFAGRHFVSDFPYPGMPHTNEVYPTILEIITEQIISRGGAIHTFDYDTSKGWVVPNPRTEERSRFAKTLFDMMQIVDWRDILTAFKTGDVEQTIEALEKRVRHPNIGYGVYSSLLGALQQDETTIMGLNIAHADVATTPFPPIRIYPN